MTNCDKEESNFMKYTCLLFDLDGTLVDSRADLAASVNLMLGELGRESLPDEAIIGFVGEGARLLVERSLRASQGLSDETAPNGPNNPSNPSNGQISAALAIFMRHYRDHLMDRTELYPGVREALDRLDGIPKAIITNKPYQFSVAILEALGLSDRFPVVIGGDSLPERKPSPLMLLEGARRCGATPAQTLMIGDSRIDIAAGRNAGMATCGFVGGFRGRDELLAAGADLLFERFEELPELLRADSPD